MTTEGSEGWWCVTFFFSLSDSETGFFFFLVPHICSHSQFLSGSVILALLQREWSVWFIWNKTLCMRFYLHFSSFRPALHLTEHASPSVSGQRGEKMSVPARWVRAFTFLPSEVKSILFHGWDLSGSTAQGGACRHPEQSRRGGGGKKKRVSAVSHSALSYSVHFLLGEVKLFIRVKVFTCSRGHRYCSHGCAFMHWWWSHTRITCPWEVDLIYEARERCQLYSQTLSLR